MVAAAPSLLLAAAEDEEASDAQILMEFADLVPRSLDRSREPFDYTGERLFRDRPEIYASVVKLLAEPRVHVSYRQICRVCHVTHRTIRAVEHREGIPIATQKRKLAELSGYGAEIMLERAIELAPEMKSAKDAAIAGGIFAEKYLLLNGEASAIVEVRPGGDPFEMMRTLHAEMVAFAIEKRAQVVELPQMGLSGGSAGQIADAADPGSELARGDSESDGFGSFARGAGEEPADSAADRVVLPVMNANADPDQERAEDEGGEGVTAIDGGAEILIGEPTRNFMHKGGSEP